MRYKLCDENAAALEMLKPAKNDRSGVGVHYVDAWLKPMKTLTLEDGTKFAAKRRGLKVTITVGDKKAEGLMRRLTVSKDPVVMLRAALDEATGKIGAKIVAEGGAVYLEK